MNISKKKTKFVKSKNTELKEINQLTESRKTVNGLDPDKIKKFTDVPLSHKTQKGLLENNFILPTKVQSQTLVHSLQGLDVVAAAKTGSGKTLAFIIPILELLFLKRWNSFDGLGVLIITPTRELAYQIYEVLNKVGKNHNFSVGLVIGGKDLRFEWRRIYGCNIIICTPGRLLHHMNENPEFSCENVQLLVLDEADQCLSMGFADTMSCILEEIPSERQTLLFSATQTREVKDLIRAGCKDPVFCSVHEYSKTATPKTLSESYMICDDSEKLDYLWSFLKHHKRRKVLVFLATCKQVKFVFELFTHLRPGLTVMALHGDMHQIKRMNIYDEFCSKKQAVLFATDVASRGLDIPSVDWVVQLDCPEDVTTYIHRAGRTARHTSCGESLLVLTPSQVTMVENLKAKSISIEKIDVNSKKLISIQQKAKFALDKYFNLKDQAERAFKSYVKNIYYMKNRKVFNVASIDLNALARSFGLDSNPRVRFLERKQKNEAKNNPSTLNGSSVDRKTNSKNSFDLGVNSDDSEDDLLCKSEPQQVKEEENPEEMLKDPTLFRKSNDYISKFAVARKVMKNKLSMNKKITFDDDGEPLTDQPVSKVTVKGEEIVVTEGQATGLNISEMREMLKSQDKIDKKVQSDKRKEKLRKEKEKIKAERKKIEEERKKEKEDQNRENEEEDDYSEEEEEEEEEESDLDSFTNEIIDDLPDPDKVYAQSSDHSERERENRLSSDEESGIENQSSSGDQESEVNSEVEGIKSSDEKDENVSLKRSREFRGKRLAKEEARASKRARIAAENNLEAISFTEKEDLALFLLKGKS